MWSRIGRNACCWAADRAPGAPARTATATHAHRKNRIDVSLSSVVLDTSTAALEAVKRLVDARPHIGPGQPRSAREPDRLDLREIAREVGEQRVDGPVVFRVDEPHEQRLA